MYLILMAFIWWSHSLSLSPLSSLGRFRPWRTAQAPTSPTWTGGETEEMPPQARGPHRTHEDTPCVSFPHVALHLKENLERGKTI